MPDNTIFKKLFEVRILHGYYTDNWFANLLGEPGSFFDYGTDPDPAVRAVQRREQQAFVLENKYDILRDISIEPTPATARLMEGLRMRWRRLPTGFLAGLEVEKRETGGLVQFAPKVVLEPGMRWTFLLRIRNAWFYNITNHAMRPTMPGHYYFTNMAAADDGKVFPSLSVQLPPFSNQRHWEMGELLRSGNQVMAANVDTANLADFTAIANIDDANPGGDTWHEWAHSGDRRALPKSFKYRFDAKFGAANPVTDAVFVLSDTAGNQIKSITRSYTAAAPAPAEILLDFRQLPVAPGASDAEKLRPKTLPDGWYDIRVSINGAIFETRRVLLRSDLPDDQSILGIVELGLGPTAPAFSLLDGGLLNTAPVPDSNPGRWQGPVFEIRFMNRPTYWHYRIQKSEGLPAADLDMGEFIFFRNRQSIEAQTPRRLSQARVPVQLSVPPPGAAGDVLLPNPEPPGLRFDHQRKIYYSELFLSTIKLT
jgi:hypothetical protein